MPWLCVDPGTTESAFVQYDDGKILGHGKIPNADLLSMLPQLANGSEVAIEMISHYGSGMAVGREVFETCLWIGRYIQAVAPKPVRLVIRREVKQYLCGSDRAKDGNIRQALIDKLGAPGVKKNPGATYGLAGDEWQALAVAVTASETTPAPENVRT